MAIHGHMTITGKTQGFIAAGCSEIMLNGGQGDVAIRCRDVRWAHLIASTFGHPCWDDTK